ncbi:transcription factor GTE1-like isoform X1 [Pistacia vera]|uniref:transcription factor GTE1-like isoform X1 n=1 Tax=Pistacia vera TaxID=55513 RepID=UPI001263B810|nr:transcription factor GTE1-like isoform X1 [Pistacia vera]
MRLFSDNCVRINSLLIYTRHPTSNSQFNNVSTQIKKQKMDPTTTLNPDEKSVEHGKNNGNAAEVEGFSKNIEEILQRVSQLEQKLNEVEQFYLTMENSQPNTSKSSSILKEKVKEKHINSIEKQQLDAALREEASARRMQGLKRQFGTIFRQITQHKWAGPFMNPVDVEGLGLHDYYEVIDKPMDLGTIKTKMDAKDGNGYKNVREIYADVRLVFKNAMKYNDERHDIHVMAKSLLEKFEEKWLLLLPKVVEEEKRQEEEEAKVQQDVQINQEVVHANMARDLSSELTEVDSQLEKLRESVIQKCRKMSTEEKKKLGVALTRLTPEDLSKALEIVAESDPNFQATAQEVDLNIDAQSETTLWRLKVFVQEALRVASKSSGDTGGNNHNDDNDNDNSNKKNNNKNNIKRRREICDTLTKTAVKRSKKSPNT